MEITTNDVAFGSVLGAIFFGTMAMAGERNPFAPAAQGSVPAIENFGASPAPLFYGDKANSSESTSKYAMPKQNWNAAPPTGVNLDNSGNQLLSFQLYQQAVNAATPTKEQLQAISGESHQQTSIDTFDGGAQKLGGGLSADTAPYNVFGNAGPNLYDSEFQAVNYANNRASRVSACAQNAPTFVATSLLPKPNIPGQETWDINAPDNILANQNFLSSTQQVGVDTVLGSLRNPSYDIRNTIPNPINVVSPWMNTTILPDLERRPLDCFLPSTGLYGCGPSGCNTDATFVGKNDG